MLMKKIFTLIATALLTMGASAQTTVFSATPLQDLTENWSTPTGETEITATYATISGGKIFTVNEQDAAKEMIKKQGGEYAFQCTNNNTYFKVVLSEALQAGDVISARLQSRTDTDLGLFFAATSTRPSETTTAIILPTAAEQAWTEAPSYTVATGDGICGETTFYMFRATGKSTYFNTFAITRTGGGSGEGGGSGDKVTYSPIVLNEGSPALAPEFAAIVDGNIATNVVDGRSIVEINRGCVTLTAVGGTTPANVSGGGGAQQITPGAKIEGEENKYEVASVEAWNNIEWKNGNNKTDIETPMYFLMGTGNPYVKLLCEEIITEGTPTGTYRADYVYYEPDGSIGLPITGLYYKFKSTEAGAFKVNVWGNKGNRKTYVVNSKDAKATKLYAEGYLEGQTGYLTTTQIDALHAEGADPAIIGTGTKFWGYLIFDIQAGDEVWVFQHSSQIGFGGYEFYPGSKATDIITPDGGDTGIIITKTVKNDADAPIYNLSGQKVDKSYKGIVIQNGRKFFNK